MFKRKPKTIYYETRIDMFKDNPSPDPSVGTSVMDKLELWIGTIVHFAEKAVPVLLMLIGVLCILSQMYHYFK